MTYSLKIVALVGALAWAACPAAAEETFGITVDLSLSQPALERLTAQDERIIVSASYYGGPTTAAEQHADDVGRINLGREELEVPAREAQTVQVTGDRIDRDRLAWIEGDVFIEVSAFSARRSGPDNLLTCDVIEGKLSAVTGAPVPMHCSLIEENRDIQVRP